MPHLRWFFLVLLSVTPSIAQPVVRDPFGDPLPSDATARLGTVRYTNACVAAYSPDGKTLALAQEKSVQLWDVATNKRLATLANSKGLRTGAVVFAPDGQRLAVAAYYGGEVDIWDLATHKAVHFEGKAPGGGTDWQACAVFTPDGKTLYLASKAHLWHLDPATAKVKHEYTFDTKTGDVLTVAFAPNGKHVATPMWEPLGKVALWDTQGKFVRWLDTEIRSVNLCRFTPDGQTMVIAGEPKGVVPKTHIVAIDIATGKTRQTLTAPATRDLFCTKDGQVLATHNDVPLTKERRTNTVALWDFHKPEQPLFQHEACAASQALFAPDQQTIVWTSCGETYRFMDRATGRDLQPVDGHRGAVHALQFAADGRTVFSASADGTVRRWDAIAGKPLGVFAEHPDVVHRLVLSPDGKYLASGGYDNTVRVWDAAVRGSAKASLTTRLRLESIAFAPQGALLACTGNGFAQVWDWTTGKRLEEYPNCCAGALLLEMPPTLLTVDRESRELRWLNRQAKTEERLEISTRSPFALALSPDGRWLALVCNGDTYIIDRYRRHVVLTLPGLQNSRGQVVFSPDSRYLASVGDGSDRVRNPQTIQLFELLTGKEVHRFPIERPVFAVAFSPDGRRLATGGADTSILLWDIEQLPTVPKKTLDEHWQTLADADAAQAFVARCALLKTPKETLALAARQLRPFPKEVDATIAKLIKELDADRFAQREQASKQLSELHEAAEPALRGALQMAKPEARERIEKLLATLKALPRTAPHERQALRGIALVERLGGPDAQALLTALADGHPHHVETLEAKAALARLKMR